MATNGSSAGTLTATRRLARPLASRASAAPTTSSSGCQSRLSPRAPDSSRVISSRFWTSRLRRSASSRTDSSSSCWTRASSRAPDSRIVVAAPVMAASGVRRSCETEVKSALRSRSVSARTRASWASLARRVRSSASAVWFTKVSSCRSGSGAVRASRPGGRTLTTPIGPRGPRRGTCTARAPFDRAAPSPAVWPCSKAQRLSVSSFSSSAGRPSVRRTSSVPSASGRSTATSAPKTSVRWRAAIAMSASTSPVAASSRLMA